MPLVRHRRADGHDLRNELELAAEGQPLQDHAVFTPGSATTAAVARVAASERSSMAGPDDSAFVGVLGAA